MTRVALVVFGSVMTLARAAEAGHVVGRGVMAET